jgi:hypothetical protein
MWSEKRTQTSDLLTSHFLHFIVLFTCFKKQNLEKTGGLTIGNSYDTYYEVYSFCISLSRKAQLLNYLES